MKFHLKTKDATASVPESGPHWQWEAETDEGPSLMFTTDFHVFFDVDIDSDGKAKCELKTDCSETGTCGTGNICKKSATYDQGEAYIKVNNLVNINTLK